MNDQERKEKIVEHIEAAAKLLKEKDKPFRPGDWRPNLHEDYLYINDRGEVRIAEWYSAHAYNLRLSHGNVFPVSMRNTLELAMKAEAKLYELADYTGVWPNDIEIEFIFHYRGSFSVDRTTTFEDFGPYATFGQYSRFGFKSRRARVAFDEIGEPGLLALVEIGRGL